MTASWKFWNRMKETLASHTGTGTFALEGSVPTGHVAFGDATNGLSNNDKFIYVAENSVGGEWEIGEGTYISAPNDIQRSVRYSSNSNALVNFSAGTLTIWLDVDATFLRDPEFERVGIGDALPPAPSGGWQLYVVSADAAGSDNALLVLENNAADGDAHIKFDVDGIDWTIGVDDSDSDRWKITSGLQLGGGTDDQITVDSSTGAMWTKGIIVGSGTDVGSAATDVIRHYRDDAGTATPQIEIDNQGAGDVAIGFSLLSKNFGLGIDNSDGDSLVISESFTLGTTNRFQIDGTSGVVWVGGMVVGNSVTASDGVDDQLIIEKNNSSTTTAQVVIDNQGTGDTLLQMKNAARNWYVGLDNSDTNDPLVFGVSAPLDATNESTSPLSLYYSATSIRVNGGIGVNKKKGNSQVLIYDDNTQTFGLLELEQDGTGDCAISFLLTGSQRYLVGIDNSSTNDDFKVSDSTALGTTDRLVIDGSTGHLWADALNLGTSPSTTNSSSVIFCGINDNGTTTPIADFMNDGTGDAFIKLRLTLGQTYCFGIDNSDGDSFILADATNISSGQRLKVDGSTGEVQVYETLGTDGELDNGNSSTADTINWQDGNHQKSTLTGNCTYTFTAPTVGTASLTLKLIQDATGSRTVTWPATVKWAGGTAPTLTTTANAVDIICFYFDGTNYHGAPAVLDSK